MSAMEPTTTSRPPASESPSTDTGETFFRTPNAPPGRHFVPTKVPGLVGPDFPFPPSVAKLFRKLFRRTDTPATR
jgi:hypothetical protein